MVKRLMIPRLGSPRINEALVDQVRKAKAQGVTDTFYTTDRRGRSIRVERRSDSDLYQRMMAARGLPVQVGET